jgi:hypothetical protein
MSKRIPALTPQAITRSQVMANFPKRPRDSHKGLFGTVAVIGGATGMIGAPLLAARAALKLGAGSVHVGLLAENAPGVDLLQPELMLHSASTALQLHGVNVLAVGCGLGVDMAAQKILHAALNSKAALVLDADALNILALHADLRTLLSARERNTARSRCSRNTTDPATALQRGAERRGQLVCHPRRKIICKHDRQSRHEQCGHGRCTHRHDRRFHRSRTDSR